MKDFLKSRPQSMSSASPARFAPQKVSLDFARLETEIPDLWVRAVIIRSRVKQLSFNFDRDAQRALRLFHAITGVTAVSTILALCAAIRFAPSSAADHMALAVTVVVAGTVAAIFASAANALGAGKRASSMFAAKWSMRALELDIDQRVHMIALEAKNGQLTPALTDKLDKAIDTWIAEIARILSSFGSEYGKANGNIEISEIKLPTLK